MTRADRIVALVGAFLIIPGDLAARHLFGPL
jgi:hypothetical protein